MKSHLIIFFFSVFCFSLDAMSLEEISAVRPEGMGTVCSKKMAKITPLSDFVGKGFLDRPSQYGTGDQKHLSQDVKTNISSLYDNRRTLLGYEQRRYIKTMDHYFKVQKDKKAAYRELCGETDKKLAKFENQVKENQVDKKIILKIEYDVRASKKAIKKWEREISRTGKIVLRMNERIKINSRLKGQAESDKLELSTGQEVISRMLGYVIKEREQVESLKKQILIKKKEALKLEKAIFKLKKPMLILPEEYRQRLEKLERILELEEFVLPKKPSFDVEGSSSDRVSVIDREKEVPEGPEVLSHDHQQVPQYESRFFAPDSPSFLQKNGMRIGLIMALGGALMFAASASQLMRSSSKV